MVTDLLVPVALFAGGRTVAPTRYARRLTSKTYEVAPPRRTSLDRPSQTERMTTEGRDAYLVSLPASLACSALQRRVIEKGDFLSSRISSSEGHGGDDGGLEAEKEGGKLGF